jgi:hypothetical protein
MSFELGRHSATAKLVELANGMRISQALYVAAELRIADLVALRPLSSKELAVATETNEHALDRVLRALCAFGVLGEQSPGHFGLTSIGRLLRSDVPGSFRAGILFMTGRFRWRCWSELLETVKTGMNRPEAMLGTQVFKFYAIHPAESEIQAEAMRSFSASHTGDLINALNLRGSRTVVDVGGGTGEFLAAILKAYPELHGVLFDLPTVVERAPTIMISAAVSERCDISAGSFFDFVPDTGDVYLLKQIVHDWDDDRAVDILKTCRRCMPRGAKIVLIEREMPQTIEFGTPNEPFIADLEMLVMTPGGRERCRAEFRNLLNRAGLALQAVISTASSLVLFEATQL